MDHPRASEELAAALRARPFRPFAIALRGAPSIRVDAPHAVAMRPGGATAAVMVGEGDGFELVDLAAVASVEFADETAPA